MVSECEDKYNSIHWSDIGTVFVETSVSVQDEDSECPTDPRKIINRIISNNLRSCKVASQKLLFYCTRVIRIA